MVMTGRNAAKNITVSVSEFKQRMGELSSDVLDGDTSITVQSYGKPRFVVFTADRAQRLLEREEMARRQEAAAELRDIIAKIRANGPGLDDDEASRVATEILREVRAERLAEEEAAKSRK